MNPIDLVERIENMTDMVTVLHTKAINTIHKLADENSKLRQRVLDLEDLIEESKVVHRWEFVDGEMRQTK